MSQPRAPISRGTRSRRTDSTDILVVGSGVAGLSAALELHLEAPDARVTVLTRGALGGHGASPLAQGGIAAAIDASDSAELHAHDTFQAGAGMGRRTIVEILTREGPEQVRRLLAIGARFDRDATGDLALGLEGAHSRRRILHADGDRTGAEVTRALGDAVRREEHIRVLEQTEALDLLVHGGEVSGVLARHTAGDLLEIHAGHTILATGGPGRVYLRTTAPPGLNGDGLAMAARAGATLSDLEFVQFHPTALDVDADPLPLVTEALRGAGAHLVDENGRRILASDEIDELASRDRVTRALWSHIREGHRVFLDAREAVGDDIASRFPGVYRLCGDHGIDPAREPIPVTPAAHYHMGGVTVDADGRCSLPRLWAVGEVASSGVHGANRLASNSLLEGLVFGSRVARAIAEQLENGSSGSLDEEERRTPAPGDAEPARARAGGPPVSDRDAGHADAARTADPEIEEELLTRIRSVMWEHVGVVRTEAGLAGAVEELKSLQDRLRNDLTAPAANLLLSAHLIARAALARRESLGSHFRADYPGGRPRRGLGHSRTRLEGRSPLHVSVDFDPGSSRQPGGAQAGSGAGSSPSRTRERPDTISAH